MAKTKPTDDRVIYDDTQVAALKREMASYEANGDTAAAREVAAQLRKAGAAKEDTSAVNADVETAD
jgi:hypothetical protein